MSGQVASISTPSSRFLTGTASFLGFWLVPALLSALAVRHLFPSATDPFDPDAGGALAKLAASHAALPWGALFLLFAAVLRYWAGHLPGAPFGAVGAKTGARRGIASVAVVVGAAALAALLFRESLFQPYRVVGTSMLPSLELGSYLAVKRFAYGFKLPGLDRRASVSPRRGDVIVFQSPVGGEAREELVKRVIGLPGDHVRIVGERPTINGWLVPACSVGQYPLVGPTGFRVQRLLLEFLEGSAYLTLIQPVIEQADTLDYLVKPGEVFVLGDNRAVSVDSRAWNHGRGAGVPWSSISGRAERILLDADRNGRPNFSHVLARLAANLHLDGVDARELETGVARCLAQRPKVTTPPALSAVTP